MEGRYDKSVCESSVCAMKCEKLYAYYDERVYCICVLLVVCKSERVYKVCERGGSESASSKLFLKII